MKKNVLLSTLLITSVIALGSAQGAFANGQSSASQTVTGNLGSIKKIVPNGGNINATIDEVTGALSTPLTPGFRITTNTEREVIYIKAECNTLGGFVNALSGTGATGSTYISLTNTGALPLPADVTDAQGAPASGATNPNVIAYGVNSPAYPGVGTWNVGLKRWEAVSIKGVTDTSLTIPGTAKDNTFSIADVDGSYQAIITASFLTDG